MDVILQMQCKNHPETAAVGTCPGCAQPYCSDCLVEILGRKYCGGCKTMALGEAPILTDDDVEPCQEAKEALIYALISFFGCGIGVLLGPLAVIKAMQARKRLGANPRLGGSERVAAALVIGVVATILWLLALINAMVHGLRLHL